jgi:hypothetical protein
LRGANDGLSGGADFADRALARFLRQRYRADIDDVFDDVDAEVEDGGQDRLREGCEVESHGMKNDQ